MNIRDLLRCLTPCPMPRSRVRPGLYNYTREAGANVTRFHLRVNELGDGLLLANAAAMARLSSSGVVLAKGLLEGRDTATLVERTMSMFRGATVERVMGDIAAVQALIERLQAPSGGYPIINLADPAFSVASSTRPISADVRLCPVSRMRPILDRLWDLGVPHVTIFVGRDPDEQSLIQAVEHAGDLGMITGVRGRGSDLHQGNRIASLVSSGLDHLDVYCLSDEDDIHDSLAGPGDCRKANQALAAALKHDICPVAQLALARPTISTIDATLAAIVRHGIMNAGVFALASSYEADASAGALLANELVPAARAVEELAEQLDVRLMWYPPVQFDPSKSLGEQVCRGPRSSGDTAIRVEPDGSVIAARGPFRAFGNVITQEWSAMQGSEAYQNYRNRLESNTHCDTCPGLALCAADCPREPAGWAAAELDITSGEP